MRRLPRLPALLLFVFCTLSSSFARAAGPAAPGLGFNAWQSEADRSEDPEPPEFRLINYFLTRLSVTDVLANPAGLRGVSLGPIGLPAGSIVGTVPEAVFYVEQRWIPVVSFAPHFVDGLAQFNAMLEVDFSWGIQANTAQQNQGGAFNADQLNIQTKNVNVALYPTRNPLQLSVVLGTHPIYDNVRDSTRTSVFDIARTGYKLSFVGSDGTGISAFGRAGDFRGKASFVFLNAGQPRAASEGDPKFEFALLGMLDAQYTLQPGTHLGLSLWHLRDDTQGFGDLFSNIVRPGPSSTGLPAYVGTPRFPINRATGWVQYAGAFFDHNIDFLHGPFGASGFVMMNVGEYASQAESIGEGQLGELSVLGGAANLELMYNHGKTTRDVITLEGMFSTSDDDPTDEDYTGAFTMNFYGLPGATWFNHKTLLLFPFTTVVSNYTGAVTDLSNQGAGLLSGILSARMDLIPYVLNAKVGGAIGYSGAALPSLDPEVERGTFIGAEVNAELIWTVRFLMDVGLHAGYMFRGDFYDGVANVEEDPWGLWTTFTWYAF
ncbi:MAG: hypothetical protein AAFZ18_08995 [Myxococcota bacterium]